MCLAATSDVTPARRVDADDTDEKDDDAVDDDTNTLLYAGAGALVLMIPILAAVASRCRDTRSTGKARHGYEQDIDAPSAYSIQSVASAYSANIPGYSYY